MKPATALVGTVLFIESLVGQAQNQPQPVYLTCTIDGTADGGSQYIGVTLDVAFSESPSMIWLRGRPVQQSAVSSTAISATGFDNNGGRMDIDRLSGRFVWGDAKFSVLFKGSCAVATGRKF